LEKNAFGISPAPEEFQRRLDEVLEGLKGVKAIHDDILIYGSPFLNRVVSHRS
jgi:hypothetical protein